jgi:fatty acid-binding protein DegV
LNIKPIMKIEGGRIEPVEKVRTRGKALARLVDLVAEEVGQKPLHVSALNANIQADAQWLLEQVKSRMNVVEGEVSDLSPVIGANAGPGTVGLAYMYD